MMRFFPILALVCIFPAVMATPSAPDTLQTHEETTPLPAAQKDAVKRVLLARAVQIKANRHRITQEAAADYVALAKRLEAPEDFVEILTREKAGSMVGRTAYEHRQMMEETTRKYGIDALQIRLFIEGLREGTQKIGDLLDWLPVRDLFNLVTTDQLKILREDVLPEKLEELRGLYQKMLDVYDTIDSRETADAAASALLIYLPEFDRTAPIRLLLRKVGSRRLPGYDKIVGDVAHRLSVRRKELFESSFYASIRMGALDALLCF